MMTDAYDEFEAAYGAEHGRTRAAADEVAAVYEAWSAAAPSEASASEAARWRALAGGG
jgi:hypothetical protein